VPSDNASAPLRIHLARHAETEWNRVRRVQGISDVALNERGLAQAASLAARFAAEPIEAVYASPLARARQTAEAVAARHGLEVQIVADLSEFDQGVLEGRYLSDIAVEYPELLAAFAKQPGEVRIPGGETLAEVQVRAWRAFTYLLERHPQGSIVAVSHNMTLLTLLCRFLGMSLDRFRRLTQSSTGVTSFERGIQGLHLRVLNDISHLPPELRPEEPGIQPAQIRPREPVEEV
jgi:phosphoserine phosphatase